MIINAAEEYIPKKVINQNRKLVPWWNNKCSISIKESNRALKKFRKNMSMDNLVEYKRKAAIVRRTIKTAKRNTWREFCSNIGRETDLGDVWNMINVHKTMPVMSNGNKIAVTEKKKANLLGKIFSKIYSCSHLSESHKKKKEEILRDSSTVLNTKENENDHMDLELNLMELKRAIIGTKKSAPGQDQLCNLVKYGPNCPYSYFS
ncbi:MAG: hypothetical protein ACRDDA_03515 [Aeromonas sp.]